MHADIVLIVLMDVCAVNPRHMSPQTPCYLGHNENVSVFSRSAERLLTHIYSNFLSSRFFGSSTEYETNPELITKRRHFLPQLTKVSAQLWSTEVTADVQPGQTLPTILSWKTGIRRNVLKRIEPSLVLSLHQSLTSFLIRLGYGDFHSCERLQCAGISISGQSDTQCSSFSLFSFSSS